MVTDLKNNIEQERKIVSQMKELSRNMENVGGREKEFYIKSLNSLKNQLKFLNNSVPNLLEKISPVKKLEKPLIEKEPENPITKISGGEKLISINKEDRGRFAKELNISDFNFKRLRNIKKSEGIGKKPSQIARLSNMIFSKMSDKLAPHFSGVREDLRKANIRFSVSTYISIALFVNLLVFLVSFLSLVLAVVINFSFIKYFYIPFVLVFVLITGFYFYPASERSSVKRRISDELPFATIHMAAIAGSNLEPTRIFKIIAMSPEYPTIGIEMRKIVNQVEIYGYDLVSSLKNATRTSSNKNLADLFSGLATNIVSGGDLKNYLEQKAENFLTDYKLERKRYTSLAETFMDVYISIMIAAPLILVVMLIVMNVTGLSIGLPFGVLMGLVVGGTALLNVIFLFILNLKQPRV